MCHRLPIKTSTNVPARGQGIDAGKKIVGRKRSIVIDTVGLLLGVLVTAASVQDSIAGQTLIEKVAVEHPSVRKTWVDGGYRQHLVEHAYPGHRHAHRPPRPRHQGIHRPVPALDRRENLGLAHESRPPGP